MEYWIGFGLALACVRAAIAIGLGRSFFAIMLMVIASYYVLFAAIGAPLQTVGMEALVASGFLIVAVIGFKTSLWFVVAALALHGGYDLVHSQFIVNPGVPSWWPPFCLTFDVIAAAALGILILRRSTITAPLRADGASGPRIMP